MMPVYRHMDSHPHQRSQSGHHQMYPIYPSNPPMVYEPWPHTGSYGYPPMPCNSCCTHGNFPSFHNSSPSYPRPMPMPSPPLHYGPMPHYPEAYPVYYAPPPHYSSEMPSFEYDKHMPWNQEHHCCGCSTHRSEDKGVRIEEQEEPNVVEPRAKGSLVPVQMKGYLYPVVWVPEEQLKEKLRPFSVNSRGREQDSLTGMLPLGGDEKRGHDQKIVKKKESPFPFIWMPSDDGDQESEKKEKNDVNGGWDKRSDDRAKQFPFPIVRMSPQDTRPKEVGDGNGKEVNVTSKQAENLPYIFNFFPMKQICNGDTSEIPNAKERNTVSKNKDGAEVDVKEKSETQKSDLVKQVGPSKEEEKPKPKETDKEASKPIVSEGKRLSLSPPKSNKLPPVCLRVDPLLKKKNGNGSSQSPSPPTAKGRALKSSDESVREFVSSKDCNQQGLNGNTLSNTRVEPKKMEPKVIAVTEKASDQTQVSVKHTNTDVSEKMPVEETAKNCDDCRIQDETRIAEKATNSENSGNGKEVEKKALSEVEAALRIQSAFRGFEVRRSQPLKKLKQISKVREQMDDVQKRIQALGSSSDARKDEKLKLIIGETIMRLLLQLDTIQGLHPSLREIRKSLAKELVSLQDKLDSLVVEPEKPILDAHSAEPVEEHGVEAVEVECKQEQPGETESSTSSEDIPMSDRDVVESTQDQLVPLMESDHELVPEALESQETSAPATENTVLNLECGNGQEVEVKVGDLKPGEPNSEATAELKEEVGNGVPDVIGTESMEADAVPKALESKEVSEMPSEEDAKESETHVDAIDVIDAIDAIDATHVDNSTEVHIQDTPTEVSDDKGIEANMKTEQIESENGREVQSVLASEVTPQAMVEEEKMQELAELPVGVIDEASNSDVVDKEIESQGTTEDEAVETEKLDETRERLPSGEAPVGLDDKQIELSGSQNVVDERAEADNLKDKVDEARDSGSEEVVFAEPQLQQPTNHHVSSVVSDRAKQLVEENEKLREMMAKLLQAGNEQLKVISDLSGRVKDLEKKLSRRKKCRTRQNRQSSASACCGTRSNATIKDRAVNIAV